MRRRVATNQKRKKNARATANIAATTLPYFPSYVPPPLPTLSNIPAAPDPQAIYAFAADAQELHRRRQQSARDKRRAHRSATCAPL